VGSRVERVGIECCQLVIERNVERAGAFRGSGCILSGDAEGDEGFGRRSEWRVAVTARKQPVSALEMQPVPVIDAISGWPFAIAITVSPSETWSTGPVTDATTSSCFAAWRASSDGSPPPAIDSTPRTSASTPTSVATSPALPRSTVTSISSRIRFAVSVRYVVAPAPTGSSTTGMPRAFATRPAMSIASTQCGESVPMLRTSAPAIAAISSTSSRACAITGSAPSASVAFAVSFITT